MTKGTHQLKAAVSGDFWVSPFESMALTSSAGLSCCMKTKPECQMLSKPSGPGPYRYSVGLGWAGARPKG